MEVAGDTPIADLRQRHVDVVELDMSRLCALAIKVAAQVRTEAACHRFTVKTVVDIVSRAVQDKRVALEEVNSNLHAKIIEHLRTIAT